MPDKDRERHYLSKLKQCIELPDPQEDTEQPDFLFGDRPNKIGVELTEYHHPPILGKRPYQEEQSLRWRVIEKAEQLHAEAGGPALYVHVIFGPHRRLSKKTVKSIAEALEAAVSSERTPESPYSSVEIARNRLPREIARVSVRASIDGKDKRWWTGSAGWAMPVEPTDIQRVIDRKHDMSGVARAKCDALWLVIVHHLVRCAPCELSAKPNSGLVRHAFDRVLWLDPHLPHVTEL